MEKKKRRTMGMDNWVLLDKWWAIFLTHKKEFYDKQKLFQCLLKWLDEFIFLLHLYRTAVYLYQCFFSTLQLLMVKILPVPGLSGGNLLGKAWSTNQSLARGWDKGLLRALLHCHQLCLCSCHPGGSWAGDAEWDMNNAAEDVQSEGVLLQLIINLWM